MNTPNFILRGAVICLSSLSVLRTTVDDLMLLRAIGPLAHTISPVTSPMCDLL